MAKIIKGYYKSGVWHEYRGKLYDSVGYNTNGSVTQKVISESLGGIMELISGYSMAIRVHGDASCSNLLPFYFVTDGESFSITLTYNKAAIALNIISIIMGETDITSTAYDDGVISIDSVTGNVTITVETSSVTDETPFYERVTANGINVLNPTALFKGLKGFSGSWTNFNLAGAYTINGWKSKTIDGNYFKGYMIAATSSLKYYIMTFTIVSQVVGIKIYVCADVKVTTASLSVARWGFGLTTGSGSVSGSNYGTYHAANEWFRHETILSTYIGTDNNYYRNVMFCTVGRTTGSSYNNYSEDDYVEIKNVKVVNLTALFGAGNEPTTPEQFRKMFPLDNYDYTTGTLCNVCPTDFVSRSRNIWDEEVELGGINQNDGSDVITSLSLRSKNYIKVEPETFYYVSYKGGDYDDDIYIFYYDENKDFITMDFSVLDNDFTTYVGTCYIRFALESSYGTTYKNDICIAPYDEAKNGIYTPYFEDVINLDVTTLKPSTGSIEQIYPFGVTTGSYIKTNVSVGDTCTYATTSSSSSAYRKQAVKAGETYRIYGWTDGAANWKQYFITDTDDVVTYVKTGAVDSRETPTVVTIEEDGYLCVNLIRYNSTTDKIEQVYDTLFPKGLKSGADAEGNIFRDEIYNDNGVWKSVLRVANTRTSNAVTKRAEYDVLSQEEVYVLNKQDIPTTFTAETGGAEYILPINGTTPTTAPVPIVAQYGAIPSRGLLGGGLTKGGGSDNGGYESEEPTEELDDVDEELGEELDEELGENSNDETEEETKEDVDKPKPVVEKQELKK